MAAAHACTYVAGLTAGSAAPIPTPPPVKHPEQDQRQCACVRTRTHTHAHIHTNLYQCLARAPRGLTPLPPLINCRTTCKAAAEPTTGRASCVPSPNQPTNHLQHHTLSGGGGGQCQQHVCACSAAGAAALGYTTQGACPPVSSERASCTSDAPLAHCFSGHREGVAIQ